MDVHDFIIEKFEGVMDKAGNPYIQHLFNVADKSYRRLSTDEAYDIGLLHDILEDTNTTEDELLNIEDVTPFVVEKVKILTRKENETYFQYIERVSDDRYATIIKIADLEHNMDITRYKEFSDINFSLMKRYHKAYKILKDKLNEKRD